VRKPGYVSPPTWTEPSAANTCKRSLGTLKAAKTAPRSFPPCAPCSSASPPSAPRKSRRSRPQTQVAISHEHAQRKSSWLDAVSLKWDNAVRPMLVQVSAGFAGAVVLVGGIALLLGMVAAPEPVMANDEPLGAITTPHYLYSVVNPRAIVTSHDTVIVVEAYVNSEGRVYDYNIVSGALDPAVRSQVLDHLPTASSSPQRLRRSSSRPRRTHLLRHLRQLLALSTYLFSFKSKKIAMSSRPKGRTLPPQWRDPCRLGSSLHSRSRAPRYLRLKMGIHIMREASSPFASPQAGFRFAPTSLSPRSPTPTPRRTVKRTPR